MGILGLVSNTVKDLDLKPKDPVALELCRYPKTGNDYSFDMIVHEKMIDLKLHTTIVSQESGVCKIISIQNNKKPEFHTT